MYEPLGFDDATGEFSVVTAVAESEPLVVSARGGDRQQDLGVDHRTRRRIGNCRRPHSLNAAAHPLGEELLELGKSADRGLADPGHPAADRGPEADRDRHRLLVVEQQRRERCPGLHPISAVDAAAGLDRVAEAPQALDVAPHRARSDLEPIGELLTGPIGACLEQREKVQQPG